MSAVGENEACWSFESVVHVLLSRRLKSTIESLLVKSKLTALFSYWHILNNSAFALSSFYYRSLAGKVLLH